MNLPPELTSVHVEEAPLLSRLVRCRRGDGGLMFMEPGAILEIRPEWAQVISPGSKQVAHNAVLRCRLDAVAAERAIERVTRAADARGAPLRWLVGPSSSPHDLPARLERAGFKRLSDLRAMAATPDAITARVRPGIAVRELTADDAETWARVAGEGFGVPPEDEAPSVEEFRYVLGHGAQYRSVLASIDGEPAGAAAVALIPAGGYLLGASVRPAFRQRGVYEALLAARVSLLRSLGALAAIVHADEQTSAPLCARYGFADVCRMSWFLRSAGGAGAAATGVRG